MAGAVPSEGPFCRELTFLFPPACMERMPANREPFYSFALTSTENDISIPADECPAALRDTAKQGDHYAARAQYSPEMISTHLSIPSTPLSSVRW